MAKRWSDAEEEHLLNLIQNSKTLEECSVTLNRSVCALIARLEKIALELYKNKKTIEEIQKITQLSIETIGKAIHIYNLANCNAEWDDKQDAWLRKYIGKYGSALCANKMGRTEYEIQTRILSLAIDDYPTTISTTIENFLEKIKLMENYIPLDQLEKIGEPPYYVVLNGRHKGIYNNIEGSKMSTAGYKNAKYKKCNTLKEIHKYIGFSSNKITTPQVTLSDEQNDVIKDVFDGKNILLMGSGGTGKSTLIKHITHLCNEQNIKIGITASTGSAAVLIDGKTVHSYLGIGLAKESAHSLASTLFYKYKKKATELKDLQMLLIDEISMINSELLTKISEFLSIVRKDDRPFGGIQIILSGDMYQLPPVQGALVFHSTIWKDLELVAHILTKIFRQENDVQFQEILERAKLGDAITDEDIAVLKSCKGQYFSEDIKPTCLYATNAKVDIVNAKEYDLLNGDEMEYATMHSNKESKAYCDTIGVHSVLKLKIGAQVMVTRNVNADLKLANGTRGVVVNMYPDYVVIRTLYGDREIRRFECINENDKHISYALMPLKLAWAITIHKAQGVTLDCCKIDIGDSLFAYGQAYTALSRVKDLRGLCVISVVKSAFKTHPEVKEFYDTIALCL